MLSYLSFIFLAVTAFGNPQVDQISQVPAQIDPIVIMVNDERKAKGLNPVTENKVLDSSAQKKACDMKEKNYWSHTDPSGNPFNFWIKNEGYKYTYAGENLAKDIQTDEAVMQAWMNSESHKKNILSDKFNEIGIGRCGNYTVQHFGNRQELD